MLAWKSPIFAPVISNIAVRNVPADVLKKEKKKEGKVLVAQSCPTLFDLMYCSLPGSCQWASPGNNTGVGSHSLLQGILPTQGSNQPGSPALVGDSLPSEPRGKPK